MSRRRFFSVVIMSIIFVAVLCSFLFIVYFQQQIKVSKLKELKLELELQMSLNRKIAKELKNDIHFITIERKIERIRKLKFKNNPIYKHLSRKALYDRFLEELKKEYPKEELENARKTLLKFGFVEEGYNLEKSLASLYGEQVGAFYDVENKYLCTVDGLPFTQTMQNTILAHELTHALQDQHYELKHLLKSDEVKKNDDMKLAAEALIEGDATLVMQLYFASTFNITFLWDVLAYIFSDYSSFNQTPMIIQENLLFPYTNGNTFVLALFRTGVWKNIDKAYLDPPVSTEQILHPEKYLQQNDKPRKIEFPNLQTIYQQDHLISENTMGEFNTHQLFRQFLGLNTPRTPSIGWGGDRYQIWENEEDAHLDLIWLTEWDTEQDSIEFYQACKGLVLTKFIKARSNQEEKNSILWKASNTYVLLKIQGDRVLYCEIKDREKLEKVENMIFN